MVKIQTNLNNFSVFDQLLSLFAPCEQAFPLTIQAGVILPNMLTCPICKGKLAKNGYNESQNQQAKAFGLSLKKGRLICTTPGCAFQLNLPQSILHQWFSKISELFENIMLSLKTKKLSPEEISRHIEETYNLSISDEYIRLKLKEIMGQIDKPMPWQEPSGVIVHDEQFVKIKGIDLKRISTVDANNSNVYYDNLHDDRTTETTVSVCQEIKKFVDKIRAVVIDGLTASKKAYTEEFVDILVQYCLFHFTKNVRDAYKEEVGYGKGKSCIPLDQLIGFFSIINVFFDHEREIIELRNLQKELNEQIERITHSDYSPAKKEEYIADTKRMYDNKTAKFLHEVRKARRRKNGIKLTLRTEEQAKELLIKAKQENVFPKQVQKQVDRLEREWVNFTHCMRDNTIPPTSNKVEQYYAMTLNWVEKNNLQSEEQFYQKQKFFLMKRYNIPLLREGIFMDFLKATFALLLTFGT
jgi:uncharacterized protein YbaR (Trm112 family)